MRDALGLLPPGYLLVPREDLSGPCFGDLSDLRGIADHLGTIREELSDEGEEEGEENPSSPAQSGKAEKSAKKEKSFIYRAKSPGWIVPVPAGYRSLQYLDSATPRPGTRGFGEEIPHVFVEDAISLGEFVSVSRARRQEMQFSDLAWNWKIDRSHGHFLVGSASA
jgi:hypothetical protein